MEDREIVDLYWKRDEIAIEKTDKKYRHMLMKISRSLLSSEEDVGEVINDTYLAAWNSMPDNRPTLLGAYLSKITRRLSISKFRMAHSKKRDAVCELSDELYECIPDTHTVEEDVERSELVRAINKFLYALDEKRRAIFVMRYFYQKDIDEIARLVSLTPENTKTILSRVRKKLKAYLESEEIL